MARERRDAARRLIADGKDPSAERQAEKQVIRLSSQATFEKIARHHRADLVELTPEVFPAPRRRPSGFAADLEDKS